MIIDCISDLHGHYPELEGGDLLIVAGDLTSRNTIYEHAEFLGWLNSQNYKKRIFIAGNHDNNVDKKFDWDESIVYLCDSGTDFECEEDLPCNFCGEKNKCAHTSICQKPIKKKLKIWGSPWTPLFDGVDPRCTAFMLPEAELEAKFALIPDDVDILVTHGPPFGILDWNAKGRLCGSQSLFERARSLKSLKLHVFGHIHEAYSFITPDNLKVVNPDHFPKTFANMPYIVNCSHVNERYEPVNKPIRVIF
jgi:Icc-related predicted phosphoesterase